MSDPDDELFDGLCLHHRQVLHDWRGEYKHESAEDFARRMNEYRRQCCHKER